MQRGKAEIQLGKLELQIIKIAWTMGAEKNG